MKISILDDYFDTIRTLPCFQMLAGNEVSIWNDHVQDDDVLAERLAAAEVLVLIRERKPASGHALLCRGRADVGVDPRRDARPAAPGRIAQGGPMAGGSRHDAAREDARPLRLRAHRSRGGGIR